MAKFILVLLALCGSAHAQTMGLHIASAHEHGGFNGVNPGVYVRLDSGWTAGIYRNSMERTSVYAGFTLETGTRPLSAAITLGCITGYNASVTPLVVPSVAYHFGSNAVRVGFIPRPPGLGGASSALHLMVEHHF